MKKLLAIIFILICVTSTFASAELEKWSGKIDRITKNEIVINDCWYRLTTKIQYLNKDGNKIDRSRFVVGKVVVAEFDESKEIIILSLTGK